MKTLSPHTAQLWGNCPASLRLRTSNVNQRPEAAAEGRVCHILTRAIYMGELSYDGALGAINEKYGSSEIKITREHMLLAWEASLFARAKGDTIGKWEERLRFTAAELTVIGNVDFLVYSRNQNTLHIVDFKFGYTPVYAENNLQLLCYALGALVNLEIYAPEPYVCKFVELHIVQPRDYINGSFKTWKLTVEECYNFWFWEIERRVTEAVNKEYARTGEHCRHCRSREYCSEFLSNARGLAETVCHNARDVPSESLSGLYDYLLTAKTIVNQAVDAVESRMLHEMSLGKKFKDWQVQEGKSRDVWTNDLTEIEAVEMMTGMELLQRKPIAISEARRDPRIQPFLSTLITKKPGALKLTRFDSEKIKQVFKNE